MMAGIKMAVTNFLNLALRYPCGVPKYVGSPDVAQCGSWGEKENLTAPLRMGGVIGLALSIANQSGNFA